MSQSATNISKLKMTTAKQAQMFRSFFLPALLAGLLMGSFVGCTSEARKARHLKKAESYFEAADYEKAKIEYMNVLRADPQTAKAFQRMGAIWLEQGAPLRAGPFLFRARQLAPNDLETRLKLARVYLAIGGLADARKEATSILEESPSAGEAVLILAEASRTRGDMEAAEEQVRKFPNQEDVSFLLASATISLRKGDLASAEKPLQKALATDPKSPLVHTVWATFHLFRKDQAKATEELKRAAELAPIRSMERLQYAEFMFQTGAAGQAAEYLRDLTVRAPDFLPAWRSLAQISFADKKFDEALALLENVFKQDGDNPAARMLEAEIRLAKGEGVKALASLERVNTAYPTVPMIKLLLGRAHLLNGDDPQAVAALNAAIAISPDYVEAILLLAQTNVRVGDAQTAVNAMAELLKKQPHLTQAELILADAYRKLGRLDEAAELFREQIKNAPQNAQSYVALGIILRQQEKMAEAREAFEKALRIAPNYLLAVDHLTELDLLNKDFASSIQRVQQQLERAPDSAELLLLQGKIYVAQREWDKAEASLTRALQLNANLPAAYELLVSVYIAAKKLPQAESQVASFLAKSPDNAGALMTLGLIHHEMKNFEKARDAYEKLLSIKPDQIVAMNNLAYLYAEQLNQVEKGQEWASKARAAEPNNPMLADTFGWILYKRGDYKQAAAVLKESAEKMPGAPEVQYHWGMASYMMGDTQSARTAFQAAVGSQKEFVGKEEAVRRLTLLSDSQAGARELGVAELETLVGGQQNDPLALVKLAEAYNREGNFPKAASTYEQALKINPTLATANLKLAEIYAGNLQNKDRALELARKARDLSPGDAQSAAILGRIAFQIGNYAWSYSLLQESLRQLSEPSILNDYAWAAYSLGKVGEARQTMERVAKAAPNSPESQNAKTFLALTSPELETANPVAAKAEMDRVLALDATYAPALMIQARLRAGDGEKGAAVTIYSEILRRFPDFAPAAKQLAALYLEDPENRLKAHELASAAYKTMPDDPELAAIFGEANFHKKDYGRAAQLLQTSDRKKPLDSTRLYYLGMSLIESRQAVQGREILQRAANGGLPEPLASDAEKVLKPLKKK